jgi:hypothetical protein
VKEWQWQASRPHSLNMGFHHNTCIARAIILWGLKVSLLELLKIHNNPRT